MFLFCSYSSFYVLNCYKKVRCFEVETFLFMNQNVFTYFVVFFDKLFCQFIDDWVDEKVLFFLYLWDELTFDLSYHVFVLGSFACVFVRIEIFRFVFLQFFNLLVCFVVFLNNFLDNKDRRLAGQLKILMDNLSLLFNDFYWMVKNFLIFSRKRCKGVQKVSVIEKIGSVIGCKSS
jgi:hypothetical protein